MFKRVHAKRFYKDNEKVSPLVTQLGCTNHFKIMSACKSMEERIFYMTMCIKEKYSARELERQRSEEGKRKSKCWGYSLCKQR